MKLYRYFITGVLFIFSPFKSFCYYLKYIEEEEFNIQELKNELMKYNTTKKFFRL